jgi:hypothetical protein
MELEKRSLNHRITAKRFSATSFMLCHHGQLNDKNEYRIGSRVIGCGLDCFPGQSTNLTNVDYVKLAPQVSASDTCSAGRKPNAL